MGRIALKNPADRRILNSRCAIELCPRLELKQKNNLLEGVFGRRYSDTPVGAGLKVKVTPRSRAWLKTRSGGRRSARRRETIARLARARISVNLSGAWSGLA